MKNINIKSSIKNIIIFFISLIMIYTLSLDIEKYDEFILLNYNSAIPFAMLIFFIYIIKKTTSIENKKLKKYAFILSLIFSLFIVIGNSIHFYLSVLKIFTNKNIFNKSILYFISYFVIFYCLIIIIFSKLDKLKRKEFKYHNIKFVIIWLLIFIAWIPYLLKYFPGILTPDPINQIKQIIGINTLTNNHPIIHTMIIKLLLSLGSLFDNYSISVFLYSIMQMLIMSAIFAFVIKWMIKNKFDKTIIIISFLFFSFYPVNAAYSITMWKDIIYSGLILVLVLIIYNIVYIKNYLEKKKNFIIVFIISILIILFRNNGFLVIIPTIFILMLYLKSYRKKLKKLLIFCIAFLVIWSWSLSSIFKIPTTSIIDAFSIPLQQIARIYTEENDKLTSKEKEMIESYFYTEYSSINEFYDPLCSDEVKLHFNIDYYKKHKINFITMWLNLTLKHPLRSTESILCNSYGYWYPGAENWVIARGIIETDEDWQVQNGPYELPILSSDLLDKIDSTVDHRNITIISMIYSIGFISWVSMILIAYNLYRGTRKNILVYLPNIIVYIHCIVSPVYAEFRYFYPIVISLPVLFALSIGKNKE